MTIKIIRDQKREEAYDKRLNEVKILINTLKKEDLIEEDICKKAEKIKITI